MTENADATSGACVIAVIPYGTKLTPRLARMPLDALAWPLGRPDRLMEGTVSDMGPDDHLIAYLSSRLLYMPRPGVRARMSAMVVEPEAVHGRKMAWLRVLWWRFHRVLSSNAGLLAAIPNGTRFHLGSTWVADWRELKIEKSSPTSLIASAKDNYPGHRLRHQVVAWVRESSADVEILGRGYAPFERKSEGLAPYRYSVIIENVREPGYFTEKLIDAFLCETVPIYWGAPDIEAIFDPRGMVICPSFEDIQRAIASVSEEDYLSRLEFIARNKDKASRYADHELAAARIVKAAAQRTQPEP